MQARNASPLSECLDRLRLSLLNDEPDSADTLVEALRPLVLGRLRYEFANADPTTLIDATHDALMAFLQNPIAYSPRLSRLDVYVARLATWRVRNAHRRQQRLGVRERPVDQEDLLQASITADLQSARASAMTERVRARLLSVARSPAEERVLYRLLADPDGRGSRHPSTVRICERWRKRARRRHEN